MIPTVASIIIKENKVLLVKHKGSFGHVEGKVGFPSGQVTTESPIETMITKLNKETGISVNEHAVSELPFKYSAAIERANGEVKEFNMKTFLVDIGESSPKETDENMPLWVDISKLGNESLLPNVKKAIIDALNYLGNQ